LVTETKRTPMSGSPGEGCMRSRPTPCVSISDSATRHQRPKNTYLLAAGRKGHVDSAEPALEYGGADWQIAGLSDCE
jgi:hypothetical protein